MGRVSQFKKANPSKREETVTFDKWEEYPLLEHIKVKEVYPSFCIVALFFHSAKDEKSKAWWNVYCISGDNKFHFNINGSPMRNKMLDGWKREIISDHTIIHGLSLTEVSFESKGKTVTYNDITDCTSQYCPCGVKVE